jgi:protein-tyrosine-phosphatase
MAEAIFRRHIEELGLTKLKVVSAGTCANKGDTLNPKSAYILEERGIALEEFSAKKVDKRMLKQSLAIVCMTDAHRDLLMEMRWKVLREAGEEEIENNIYSFSELTGYEVLDPYGRDLDCYRYVYELIAGGMKALTEKLLPLEIRKKLVEKPKKNAGKTAKKE